MLYIKIRPRLSRHDAHRLRIFELAKPFGRIDLAMLEAVITVTWMTAFFLLIPNRKRESLHRLTECNLKKAGWSWGCVSALDCVMRTIWIVDAHRDDGKRFVVRG